MARSGTCDQATSSLLDVAGVDLVERAVVPGLVGAVIGQPVLLGRLGIQRRSVLRARWRGSDQGSHRQSGAAGEISLMESHLYPSLCSLFVGPNFRQRLIGSEVQDRWIDRRDRRREEAAALLAAGVKETEDRAKDCFQGGRHFSAWRHMRSLPRLVCPVLPPAMSVRCTMTCPSLPTPLVDRIVVFLWSVGRPWQPSGEVTPATAQEDPR